MSRRTTAACIWALRWEPHKVQYVTSQQLHASLSRVPGVSFAQRINPSHEKNKLCPATIHCTVGYNDFNNLVTLTS
jgi:hypothetical protein